MKIKPLYVVLMMTLVFSMAGCGGGGGGGGGGATSTTVSKAIIKLSTANVPTGKLIAGIDVSLQLPTGVTPTGLSGNNASSAIAVSGVASGLANTLSGASFFSGLLKINQVTVPSVNGGMPMGEFLTITCDVASGAALSGFPAQATIGTIIDSNLSPITGVTVPISVTFQ